MLVDYAKKRCIEIKYVYHVSYSVFNEVLTQNLSVEVCQVTGDIQSFYRRPRLLPSLVNKMNKN